MATGSVMTGIVDANTALLGDGSSATLLTVTIPTNGRLICTPSVLYQRTTTTDNGYRRLRAIVVRDSGTASVSATGGTSATVDVGWADHGLALSVSAATFKVVVTASGGEARFVGTLHVTQVEQPVVVS